MTCSLSWSRRDEDGKKFQIEFKLVRQDLSWIAKRIRYEPRETYKPEAEDWEALMEQMDRNLKRGKVTPEDYKFLKRKAKEALEEA